MSAKSLAVLTTASLLAFAQTATADNHQDVAKLAKQVQQLEKQTRQLKRQLNHMQKGGLSASPKRSHTAVDVPRRSTFTSRLGGIPVATSPYLGQQTNFNGGHLLVMYPSVNEDLRLLHYRRHAEDALNTRHVPQPDEPFIKLSGRIEGEGGATRDFNRTKSNDVNLNNAELAVLMGVNPYVTGFFTVNYDASKKDSDDRRAKNGNFYLKKGFITIGRLNKSPFYATIGQTYPAFGRYSSAMLSSPLTLELGRIHTRMFAIGYSAQDALGVYGSAFVFKGDSEIVGHGDKVHEGGANLDYVFEAGGFHSDIGASVVTNIGESETMSADNVFGKVRSMQRRVPGLDVHALIKKGPVALIAEYVAATRRFDAQDMTFNNKAAKPAAYHVELGYNFDIYSHPSNIAVGYSASRQALALGMPKKRYIAAFNTSVFKDTVQTIEFRHEKEYPGTDSANLGSGVGAGQHDAQSGRHLNAVIGRFGIYF